MSINFHLNLDGTYKHTCKYCGEPFGKYYTVDVQISEGQNLIDDTFYCCNKCLLKEVFPLLQSECRKSMVTTPLPDSHISYCMAIRCETPFDKEHWRYFNLDGIEGIYYWDRVNKIFFNSFAEVELMMEQRVNGMLERMKKNRGKLELNENVVYFPDSFTVFKVITHYEKMIKEDNE